MKINRIMLGMAVLLLIPITAYAQKEAASDKLKKLRIPLTAPEKREQKLAQEIERLSTGAAALKKENDNLKSDIAKLKTTLAKLKHQNTQFRNKNRRLKSQVISAEELKKRLAVVYDELGTAYTHVKKYDMAIDVYSQALIYNPVSPKVHYNIALLYQHSRNESEKAIYHLRIYLRLNPNAKDRKEVAYLIKTLSQIIEEEKFTDAIISGD